MISNQKKLEIMVFWGATGQSKVLEECLKDSGMELVAIFDNNESLRSPFEDVPLFFGKKGFQQWYSGVNPSEKIYFLVAIGGDKGKDRLSIHEYLESHNLITISAIHPSAFVACNAIVGAGSQILANASVCAETVIGKSCIINTGAVVDHKCKIGDGVHIAPGATLAGCVTVDDCATIYTGAIVAPRITIGKGAIIGAGAVVVNDVPADSTVVGNPAKPIDRRY